MTARWAVAVTLLTASVGGAIGVSAQQFGQLGQTSRQGRVAKPEPAENPQHPAQSHAALGPELLASRAQGVLRKYCSQCHGPSHQASGTLDLMDSSSYISENKTYLVAEGLRDSLVWQRLRASGEDHMPPRDQPQPSAAEVEVIRRWILRGLPKPGEHNRRFVSLVEVFTAIGDDLSGAQEDDRRYYRYFSLTHLHNDSAVSTVDLHIARAALSKAVNSLSWEPELVLPQPVDTQETILRVDVRDLGWHLPVRRREIIDGQPIQTVQTRWSGVVRKNPYAVTYHGNSGHFDPNVRKLADQIMALPGMRNSLDVRSEVLLLRADWFIAQAMSPPIYHQLLDLPETLEALEQRLGVHRAEDFQHNRLRRGGVIHSGVSAQNRLLDRHPSLTGFYWLSYDFAPEDRPTQPVQRAPGKTNLKRYPLGPQLTQHPEANVFFAAGVGFEHDGGEAIFSLPNGLHSYMIADGRGRRLDVAPVSIVVDKLNRDRSQHQAVVNGLSCVRCHKAGINEFQDDIRQLHVLKGANEQKLLQLLAEGPELNRLLARDRQAYLQAVQAACGPFLESHPGLAQRIATGQIEPISEVAARYHAEPVTLRKLALEMGLQPSEALLESLRARLQQLRVSKPQVVLEVPLGEKAGATVTRRALEAPPARGRRSQYEVLLRWLNFGGFARREEPDPFGKHLHGPKTLRSPVKGKLPEVPQDIR